MLDATTESFTTLLKSNYDTAYTNNHTHSNKTILDAIQESLTTSLKSNYDTAYTNTHTHANKSSLDLVNGTNTGDETNATIKTKLGEVSGTNEGYVTPTMYNLWNNASGGTGKALVSATDTTSDYLASKLLGSTNITVTKGNAGANETLTFASTGLATTTLSNITQATALTNLGFAGQSLTTNGYYKFPNGLIIQWVS